MNPVVLYVGTRKLLVLEAALGEGDPRIVRHALLKNPDGFEKGFVVHLQKAAAALQKLVEGFLPERGSSALSAWVVLGNSKLRTYGFSSSQYYPAGPRTLSSHEIRSVVEQTRSIATLPLSEFILQAVPESFLVNDMAGVRDPLGLTATRLGVDLKIFTMDFQDFKNISKAFEAAEIEVEGYFPKTLAVSEAVLTSEEKEKGVVLADIADDGVSLVLWKNGNLIDTRVLPLGSRTLTAQIAARWEIEPHDAEKVKEQFGSLNLDPQFGDELIPLIERNGKNAHQIHRQAFQEAFLEQAKQWLAGILSEIDSFAREKKAHHPHLVFTGGGTAGDGFLEFLQKQFSREARIGLTRKVEAPTGLLVDPSLAGAFGMVRWLAEADRQVHRLFAPTGLVEKTLATARDWFSAYF